MDPEHATLSKIDELSQGRAPGGIYRREGVTHRLVVSDPQAVAAVWDFKDRKLYIADGHHRYETALNFRNYCRQHGLAKEGDPADDIVMMLVDMEHDGLVVFPTHRLLRDLKDFDPAAAKKACEPYFQVEEKTGPADMERVLMKIRQRGKGFRLLLRRGPLDPADLKGPFLCWTGFLPRLSKASRSLDVTVLYTLVLEKLFGIDKEKHGEPGQFNLTPAASRRRWKA